MIQIVKFSFFIFYCPINMGTNKQYTEQLCYIKQYLILVYDILTAPTITVRPLT